MTDLTKLTLAELRRIAKGGTHQSAVDAVDELHRRAQANDARVDFTGAFERLREALGPWLGKSGGLCAILEGIEDLREKAGDRKED